MMAVLMLAMAFEQVIFAMGGEATWFPPLYFGICSVAYVVLLIVEVFEENESIKGFADALSHIFGVLSLASLVGIVSIGFALGLLCSIALVSLWYATKHLRNHNNPPQAPVDSRSEKIHLLLLTSLGGAIVFGQIALAVGMRPTPLPPTCFGICAVVYMFFRWIEIIEDHVSTRLFADYVSRSAALLSLVFFVGIISEEFALGISIAGIAVGILWVIRYLCAAWWTTPTPQELADEVQNLIASDEQV